MTLGTLDGYSNNNPGNIRKTSNYWLGEVSGSSPSFKTFSTMAWGYRAMFQLLKTYISNGYNTINKIINRWAPTSENDTRAYINHVVSLSGISEHAVISSSDQQSMTKIVAAMAWHENGSSPDFSQIEAGWELLGEVTTAKTVGFSLIGFLFFGSIGYLLYHILKVK